MAADLLLADAGGLRNYHPSRQPNDRGSAAGHINKAAPPGPPLDILPRPERVGQPRWPGRLQPHVRRHMFGDALHSLGVKPTATNTGTNSCQ